MALFKYMSREERQKEGMQFLVLIFLIPVWVRLEYAKELDDYAMVFGLGDRLLPKMRCPNFIPEPLKWLAMGMLGAWMYVTDSMLGRASMPVIYLLADQDLLGEDDG